MVNRNNQHYANVGVAKSSLNRSASAADGVAPRLNGYAATAAAFIVRDFGAKGAGRDDVAATQSNSVSGKGLIQPRGSALADSRCSLHNLLCIIRKVIAPP